MAHFQEVPDDLLYILGNWTREDILCTKTLVVTIAEVERFFSALKYVLSDRRQSFTIENLRIHVTAKFFTD